MHIVINCLSNKVGLDKLHAFVRVAKNKLFVSSQYSIKHRFTPIGVSILRTLKRGSPIGVNIQLCINKVNNSSFIIVNRVPNKLSKLACL